MEKGRGEFGRDSVSDVPGAEHRALGGISALRVAALYHKILDYTMEEGSVVKAFARKFEYVVAVQRRFIVQFHDDIAV